MKTKSIFFALLSALFFFISCEKEPKGTLEIQCYNPLATNAKSKTQMLNTKSKMSNPPLVGDTTETITVSLKLGIGDVWVSKEEVKEGEPDNLKWIKLTKSTNTELKLFEDYVFPAVELPAGTYRSIKITLRNVCYRKCILKSDPTVVYELLETMGSQSDPCNPDDESWARTNYFSTDGNHYLDGGVFKLAAAGEKIGSFTVESDKKAKLIWRFGAGATDTCTNYLIDVNGNREWDCGIDRIKIECPPSVQYMWDFIVEYE